MRRPRLRRGATFSLAVLAVSGLAACSSNASGGGASNGKVTITIGDRPPASQKASQENYDSRVSAFEKTHPDIILKPVETTWNTTTFQAMVAGGNLPDVLQVPFTEPQKLIANHQIADLTQALKATGIYGQLNPGTLAIGRSQSGDVYAVPTSAYAIGLVYNRTLFKKAGLNPASPPTTWNQVRADAKIIKDKTGVPGYGQMAAQNFGGWMFTAITDSYGGSMENAAGTKATFVSPQARQALQMLHDMRWVDNSVSHNALYNYDTINKDFAAGQFAMFIAPPSFYGAIVTNDGMNKNDYGAGPMPQANGANATLSGGSVQVVNPNTTEAEREAAVTWIHFMYLAQYTDKSAAVSAAKAAVASNTPVGLPDLSVVSASQQAQYTKWIAPYVDVPVANFAPFASGLKHLRVLSEPPVKAQQVYATLDSVIQTVLTNKNASISSLLSSAQSNVDAILGR